MTEPLDAGVLAPHRVPLGELVGDEPAVVVFFKESCGTCQLALPVFQHWSSQIKVLGISQDDPATTAAFFDEYAIDMEVAFDGPAFEASAAFDIESVPATFLIDNGSIEWSTYGWNMDKVSELSALVGELSGSEPVVVGAEGLPPYRPG